MKRRKKPEILDLSIETLDAIKSRVTSNSLLEEDKKILLAIVVTYVWLLRQLQSTKFTIHRLKKMFGFSTEKHRKSHSKDSNTSSGADTDKEDSEVNQSLSLNALQCLSKEPPKKK